MPVQLTDEAREHFLRIADGDARRLLNSIDVAALTTPPDSSGNISIDLSAAEASSQQRSIRYDKKGDHHYDVDFCLY